MDTKIELLFLRKIEIVKNVLLCKENTKPSRQARSEAWSKIKENLLIETGSEFTETQLQKKWSNIQSRVKEKLRDSKKTGGGPPLKLSENDLLCYRILGENNPKLAMVRGAFENTEPLAATNVVLSEDPATSEDTNLDLDFNRPAENNPNDMSFADQDVMDGAKPHRKRKRLDNDIDELHRDVLLLQKEKLQMKLKVLRKQIAETCDKSTQTENL